MSTLTGVRVVRGRDWSHGNQDGGEGHLGTVLHSGSGVVSVLWDGEEEMQVYLAGKDGVCDLRVFDNAKTGVSHKTVTCDACGTDGIAGIRWKCAVCDDFDLCSSCYHSDKHYKSHAFFRYVTTECMIQQVPPRSISNRKELVSPLTRAQGKDVEEYELAFAMVKNENMNYDLKITRKVKLASGSRTFYPEHLPHLDAINLDHCTLKKGDKVKIGVDLETCRKLHKETIFGWNDNMEQCFKEVGTIVSILRPTVMRVQYEDAKTWTVLRSVLHRLNTFHKGDTVKIINDSKAAMKLQAGHGGWNEKMKDALGKVTTLVQIDGDGDMLVVYGGQPWLLSPVCCTLVKADASAAQADTQRDTDGITSQIRVVSTSDDPVAEFFQAADQGRLDIVENFVANNKDKINVRFKSNTALQVACFSGQMPVVRHLLENGANIKLADDEGNTALHYAVDGEKVDVLMHLCLEGADKNQRNVAGLTALHKAVNQGLVYCVKVLLNRGADVNIQDDEMDTPLHDAIKKGNHEIIDLLLDCDGLDTSLTNKDKLNSVHLAVIHGQEKVVERTIAHNQELASAVGGIESWTPLHLAAINSRTTIAGLLVKNGKALINPLDKNKHTPLHYAVQTCESFIIEFLLGRDADPNIQDVDGNTPAHLAQMPKLPIASHEGRDKQSQVQTTLCMLVESGADLGLKNKAGKTPLDLCTCPQLASKLSDYAGRVRRRQVDGDLPSYWSPMDGKELVVQDLLTSDPLTSEYFTMVRDKFLATMVNVEVKSIQRIQNHTLWATYQVTKQMMERRYGHGCAEELFMFHGTGGNKIDAIQHQNIDPLYAGTNVGAIWGRGSYFAINAKLSDSYAQTGADGLRCMFMARVLAGKKAQGSKGLQRPPALDPTSPLVLADSVVDDMDNPQIYVIFRNQQIYPEFLVKYK